MLYNKIQKVISLGRKVHFIENIIFFLSDFSAEADKFTLRAVGTFITYELTPTSVDGNLQFEIPDTLVAGRYDVSLLHSDYGEA